MPPKKKILPPASFRLLIKPESDTTYRHFEDAKTAPFDPTPGTFSYVNAWWLADASLLAYWDPAAASKRFLDAGLKSRFIEVGGTQCYVVWTDAFGIVSFRGTEPDALQDYLTNAQAAFVPWNTGGERVHGGFKEGLDRVWTDATLVGALKAIPNRPVWFTGHSLGAAQATLAADRVLREGSLQGIGPVGGVYTFGSPLIGNRRFVDGFNKRMRDRCARFVNDLDVVTNMPPHIMGYRHVNDERFVGSDDPELLLSEPLIDHTPLRYAVLVWNAYVDSASA